MKELTKEQKLRVLEEMLKFFGIWNLHKHAGLCSVMHSIRNNNPSLQNNRRIYEMKILDAIPELYKFKPIKTWNNEFWFEPFFHKPRRKVIKQTIKYIQTH